MTTELADACTSYRDLVPISAATLGADLQRFFPGGVGFPQRL